MKTGRYAVRRSRVTISRRYFPRWEVAAETAACIAVARHGGMPTKITPIY